MTDGLRLVASKGRLPRLAAKICETDCARSAS